jgi:hypothetical protein
MTRNSTEGESSGGVWIRSGDALSQEQSRPKSFGLFCASSAGKHVIRPDGMSPKKTASVPPLGPFL